MNDLNWIESRARRWTPRRPSPELRQSIFGTPAVANTEAIGAAILMRWLVPATGCFLLLLATLNSRLPHEAAEYSGPRGASFLSAADHSELNNLPRTTLERSFGRGSTSVVLGTLVEYTNKLRR